MQPRAPGAPFDQGLFLTHLNKGREAYEARRFTEAERELEEAYLLRPRDQKVLNLLGLTYFKQERFDKAEEVYLKLVAESPDASTLHYNLGLIHFKLERLEEAESSFLKALELSGENPKIRFYLGSICERLRRFQDAIYQYRQAGAHLLVRRVESKLAAAPPPSPPPPSPPPPSAAALSATLPGAPREALGVPLPARPAARKDDTARVRAEDVREALRQAPDGTAESSEETLPGLKVEPIGRSLLAEDAPPRVESDTARFRAPVADEPAQPFRALENALVEVEVAERVFIRPGTLYSYSGAFAFWVKERRSGGHPALAIATGKGRLMLRDRGREVTFLRVEGESLTVEPDHLLACEASLQPRFVSLGDGPGADFLVLEGRGLVALSVAGRPLALAVAPELPVSVPAASVITWNGELRARLVDDPQLREAMAAGGGAGSNWLRFEGRGRVLVEQPRA
jgi:tetratricopeptide (TPR) repeat protein